MQLVELSGHYFLYACALWRQLPFCHSKAFMADTNFDVKINVLGVVITIERADFSYI